MTRARWLIVVSGTTVAAIVGGGVAWGQATAPPRPARFAAPRDYPTDLPSGVAVGDVNRDGRADVVVVGESRRSTFLSVRLGRGGGRLGSERRFRVFNGDPEQVALGDFNGDGKPDAVVSVYTSGIGENGYLQILLGLGRGRFGRARGLAYDSPASKPAVGDFNRDGTPDLALTDSTVDGSLVSIVLGGRKPRLRYGSNYTIGRYPVEAGEVVARDFNHDGRLDVAYAVYQADSDHPAGRVVVRRGNGRGGLGRPRRYPIGGQVYGVAAADLNGDRRPDLAVTTDNGRTGSVAVLLARRNGTFRAPRRYPAGGFPDGIAPIVAGDFNLDCRPDLAVTVSNHGPADDYRDELAVLVNDGHGGLLAPDVHQASGPTTIGGLAAADLDRDGRIDLAVTPTTTTASTLSVLHNVTKRQHRCR